VWDLATGAPVGNPLTGHDDSVNAVAVAELKGRPVVISGGDDRTVRVWDLTTGAPVGDPFTGHGGLVNAVVFQTRHGLIADGCPAFVGIGARNVVTVSAICVEGDGNLRWEQIAAPEVRGDILALASMSRRAITVATELGIVAFDLPRTTV
jgi:WD domain, G-beta repeat